MSKPYEIILHHLDAGECTEILRGYLPDTPTIGGTLYWYRPNSGAGPARIKRAYTVTGVFMVIEEYGIESPGEYDRPVRVTCEEAPNDQ